MKHSFALYFAKRATTVSSSPVPPQQDPGDYSSLTADFTTGNDTTVDPKDLAAALVSISESSVVEKKDQSKSITEGQILAIIDRVAKIRDISRRTALGAISALFRKGAANAGAAKSMSVDIRCQDYGTITEVSKYDIEVSTQEVLKHKNVRKVAEFLAPDMLAANLASIKANPLLDLKGDLANRINKILLSKQQDPLSRTEEICCCTYAQWMPNLNDLAQSKRLKALLTEDLLKRNKSSKNKKPQQNNNSAKAGKK